MTKRILILLYVSLTLLPSLLSAAPRKHWYKDPKCIIGGGVIIASTLGDAITTADRKPYPQQIETNPILGRNPSNRRIALFTAGLTGFQLFLHVEAWRVIHHEPIKASCHTFNVDAEGHYRKVTYCSEYGQDNWFWRDLAYAGVPTAVALTSGRAAVRNYELK